MGSPRGVTDALHVHTGLLRVCLKPAEPSPALPQPVLAAPRLCGGPVPSQPPNLLRFVASGGASQGSGMVPALCAFWEKRHRDVHEMNSFTCVFLLSFR